MKIIKIQLHLIEWPQIIKEKPKNLIELNFEYEKIIKKDLSKIKGLIFNFLMKNLKKIKGDASFRKFFRKKNKNRTSIIVFAKKEKLKNLLIYDAINKILIKIKF